MKPSKKSSNDGADLLGLENDGGDIIMLPSKKKKGKKGMGKNQLNTMSKPKLSKSQKRKLKKLEEEKEKELQLSKSMETLEKYKLGADVYSLMYSSRNLGQVETVREKRRREVEFAKAGLQLPDSDQPFAKRRNENASPTAEVFEENIHSPAKTVQSSLAEEAIMDYTSNSVGSSENEVCESAPVTSDGCGVLSVKEVANSVKEVADSVKEVADSVKEVDSESIGQSVLELSQKSTHSSHVEEMITSKNAIDEDPEYNLNQEKKQEGNCSSARELIAPTVIQVSRPKDVEKQRMGLPIIMMEQEIMEAINDNSCVIICGETGCGKTTQVPQFLYEAGFGSNQLNTRGGVIGITQPRRVAVLATAKRVATELGVRLGKEVGFQVRHDKRVGENCSIKFMTDGILLREVQSDFLLKRYSVIILDEAHERSLNTDILIGMLSRVIQSRQSEYENQQEAILAGKIIESGKRIYPLKLVLMSATLRVEDFVSGKRIFREPPPVIEVPTRQYPVTTHFAKKTKSVDYISQAFNKVLSIHKRLPPGGILVFVTGQREVVDLCEKLRKASREIVAKLAKGNNDSSSSFISEEKIPEENDIEEIISEACEFQGNSGHDITERFSSYIEEDCEDFPENESDAVYDSSEESDLEYSSDEENKSKPLDNLGAEVSLAAMKAGFESLAGKKSSTIVEENVEKTSQKAEAKDNKSNSLGPLLVLPLYAMLPAKLQLRVFDEVKEGERLVVVATNVAETSLTIPGIKYVVDTGKEKVKNYNSCNGMETYEIQWISKASAAQRAGRAGRTGPGHCYRLYSSAAFGNVFSDFSKAEISKVPVDGVVLLMKSMDIGKVANFPFPTPPETEALKEAERCLKVLEALDEEGRLTTLGKAMSRYPMSPRHSRMLLTVIQIMQKAKEYSKANLVLAYAVAAAAALSLSNPFQMRLGKNQDDPAADDSNKKFHDKEEKSKKQNVRKMFFNPTSDALTIAHALQCFEVSENKSEFCSKNFLHEKTMDEMSKLRKQLLQLVFASSVSDPEKEFSWNHGTLDDVENAWTVSSNDRLQQKGEEILRQAIFAGWADRVAKRIIGTSSINSEGERKKISGIRYQACMVKEEVYLHRGSSTYKTPPEYLVYSELLQAKRPYIHGATSVDSNWLPQYARSLCTFSAPIAESEPYYDPVRDEVFSLVTPTFGQHLWQLPPHGLPIKDKSSRVTAFAYSLLEGQILPCFKDVKKSMAPKPVTILKPQSRGNKQVVNLLSKLNMKGRVIDSLKKLRALWRDNPKELFSEIEEWFEKGFRVRLFEDLWAEMIRQAFLDYEERFPKQASGKKKRGT